MHTTTRHSRISANEWDKRATWSSIFNYCDTGRIYQSRQPGDSGNCQYPAIPSPPQRHTWSIVTPGGLKYVIFINDRPNPPDKFAGGKPRGRKFSRLNYEETLLRLVKVHWSLIYFTFPTFLLLSLLPYYSPFVPLSLITLSTHQTLSGRPVA